MPFEPLPSMVTVVPADPGAVTSATYLMCGLGVAGANAFTITPQVTGRVVVIVYGNVTQSNTATTGTMQLSFGTGAAPAFNAAVAGTQTGGQVTFVAATFVGPSPFCLIRVITGLAVPTVNPLKQTTASTPVWLDVAVKSSANSISLTNLTCTAFEI